MAVDARIFRGLNMRRHRAEIDAARITACPTPLVKTGR
jgi:hypothetical protein